MNKPKIILITGTGRGIGKHLAKYFSDSGYQVIGCSRGKVEDLNENYKHFCLDIRDEKLVLKMFNKIRKTYGYIDILINNAGIASMNHFLLTSLDTVKKILETNVAGTFLFCRESAKLMQKTKNGRIINFTTVAEPLKIEGESIYAASKAAVNTLTRILSKELAFRGITVNAIGPTPIKTDLIAFVPKNKIKKLIETQAIKRYGEYADIINVIDFFIKPESNFITGQIIYLGGI